MNICLPLFLCLALAPLLPAEEQDTVNKEWLVLSAHAQEAAHKLHLLGPTGGADPEYFEQELEGIEVALERLVEAGDLVEKVVNLVPPEQLGDDGFEPILDFADTISETYGRFVAMELLDMGLERRISMILPDQPLPLRVRLPAEQLEQFLKMANENGILAEPTPEQPQTVVDKEVPD